ncbi:hypothetical protein Kfla_6668 [Kribbella flavida DSM 17836]|uniref:Uncharacterized protein n=1 Tax=Kribbella flavida (strain DSM 17836 / JCM 10339 / NBRC 14399) TaxID=479435 RepID=D2PZU4_KRIFD|nr:hypothetical protein [Kribbella flavida]ADB35660.1 hypothetical protein Kfla_6668 [Kribbella flavida DSM 17836]
MKTSDIDAVTRGLKPTTRAEVAAGTWSQLADDIVATTPADDSVAATTGGVPQRKRPARPRLVLVGAFSLLIIGIVAVTVVRSPGQDQPQALSFTESGDSLIVRVVDVHADPQQYTKDFKTMGLDIKVTAVPVSPPRVGKFVSYSVPNAKSKLKLLQAGEKCSGTLNASDPGCQEGVEVPKNFVGWAEIEFGRAAKRGELYQHFSSNIDDPGEILDGVKFRGLTVAKVKPVLAAHGLTIESYHAAGTRPEVGPIDTPPDTWYVHDATSYVAGEVVLDVAESKP